MKVQRSWVLRLAAAGMAMAVALSGSEAQAQTKRPVNSQKFFQIVSQPSAISPVTTLGGVSSTRSALKTSTSTTASGLVIAAQSVTNFPAPLAFGVKPSGFSPNPQAGPTPGAGDPNPSPSE